MSVRTSHRVSAGFAPLIAAGLLLSACGGSDGAAESRPTVKLEAGETSYATLPVATTPVVVDEASVEEADPSSEQEYTVRAGDYPIKIADDFGVSLEDLENANGWSNAALEFPGIGGVIKIPAGGTAPSEASATPSEPAADGEPATPADDAEASDDGESTDDGETSDDGETGEPIPEPAGDGCEAGSHTVAAGDIPLKLVDLYDVTLEALDAANADNPAYGRFIPGEKIIIPAKDDC